MFRAATQNRIFQDVVDQIQEAILDGRLRAGDTLPPERELKEMFNTSRGTLREALRVLEQKGLIAIKLGVGGGSVVRSVDTDQMSESLALLIRSQTVSLDHLAEFREAIEGIVAAQAARRATRMDVERLEEILDAAEACIDRQNPDRDGFIDKDRQFHLTLAQITGNPIYKTLIHSVHDNIHKYYDDYLSMERRELNENFRDLKRLMAAVALGAADEAGIQAAEHVRRFNTYMIDRQRQQNNHQKKEEAQP